MVPGPPPLGGTAPPPKGYLPHKISKKLST